MHFTLALSHSVTEHFEAQRKSSSSVDTSEARLEVTDAELEPTPLVVAESKEEADEEDAESLFPDHERCGLGASSLLLSVAPLVGSEERAAEEEVMVLSLCGRANGTAAATPTAAGGLCCLFHFYHMLLMER